LNAPFTRFNEDVEKYPDFIGDIDDVYNKSYEHFDRFKYFDPKKGSTVGQHFWLPKTDDDTKLVWGDNDGDTPFSDPPDPNMPAVDHGLDEDNLWNFNRTPYNQALIKNKWKLDYNDAKTDTHLPPWSEKLKVPTWYTDEKL
jgi:hypothetical protein